MSAITSALRMVGLRISTSLHLGQFLWKKKLWWIMPMILLLILSCALIIALESSPIVPVIYTIF